MLYPPITKLLTNVESRYLLVNTIAKRARRISEEAEKNHIHLPEKAVTLAIHEIADGKLSSRLKDEYKR